MGFMDKAKDAANKFKDSDNEQVQKQKIKLMNLQMVMTTKIKKIKRLIFVVSW